ncbi:HEAT repeat domain-containing protein [Spirillospora sp. NPDC029432]|uniref:HEAT repeat domain-containing protein n=1 Tax=Spirillospora sp. NPDC029432 TaxID=3154599 RepID=UPI0034522E51
MLDRPAYLEQTVRLLDDPRPDVVRSAVRTLAHGGWTPAVPDLVGLLADGRPAVRRAAADGLVLLGDAALPALRHAAGRARPDRRRLYASLTDRIAAAP